MIKDFLKTKDPFIKFLKGLIIFFVIISIFKLGYGFGKSLKN